MIVQEGTTTWAFLHESCCVFSSAITSPACSVTGRCCSSALTQFSILLEHKPSFQLQPQTVSID
jgi:hypothetical protein